MLAPSKAIADRFGRKIEYLRVSVTDRCDLRCTYCIPESFKGFEEPENWLSHDELVRLVGVFGRLGVTRIRLTGGEPLTRRGLPDLAARLKQLPGIDDLSLSTNATQLAKCADELKRSGIDRLNVSLDSLRSDRLREITRKDCLDSIIGGLMAAKRAGFNPIKINMVAMQGINDDEIDDMVAFCMEHGFILRLIETMPMGVTGRNAGFLDLQPIKQRLRERFDLVDGVLPGGGPARYLKSVDGRFSVGFITPISQHFCDTCNRVRLSVEGSLYLCLGQDDKFEFRPLLRSGASDSDLVDAVYAAINRKPERHDFSSQPHKMVRIMAKTGG
ncbi:MAG: GTP 3',8-cyclase MoaA [Sulfuricellaceae bacterium]|nr:GTP 3',8-cyclase MoaA [Sulfuricellaceae bacterium]